MPGVTYVVDISINTPTTSTLSPLIYLNDTLNTWIKNFSWLPTASDIGFYPIIANVTDNLNQKAYIGLNLSIVPFPTDPDIAQSTGSPSSVLTETFLSGSNGFMTFHIDFNSKVKRPTKQTYFHIFNSYGVEVLTFDASRSGFVYYIDNKMFFDIPVNTFPTGGYYITFDEGVGVSYGYCKPLSTAVTSNAFWAFSIPGPNTTVDIYDQYQPLRPNCQSTLVNVNTFTSCTQSSFILLLFLIPLSFILLHLCCYFLVFCYFKKRLFPPTPIVKPPYFFKLYVPVSYELSLK